MQKQQGNFLLQALLALTLVFAFLPFLAGKLSSRDRETKMYAAKESIETVHTVARIYIREEKDRLPYNVTEFIDKNAFSVLESYGLPMGFNPKTALGQNIDLIIEKTKVEDNTYTIDADMHITGGDLSEVELKQLARMIGFYATVNMEDKSITVHIPFDIWDSEYYSVLVRREEPDPDNAQFDVELDMGGNNIGGVSEIPNANRVQVLGAAGFDNLSMDISASSESTFSNAFDIEKLVVKDTATFFEGSPSGSSDDLTSTYALYVPNSATLTFGSSATVSTIGTTASGVNADFDNAKWSDSFSYLGSFSATNWKVQENTIANKVLFNLGQGQVDINGKVTVGQVTSNEETDDGSVVDNVVADRVLYKPNSGSADQNYSVIDLTPGGVVGFADIYVPEETTSYSVPFNPFVPIGSMMVQQCSTILSSYNISNDRISPNSLLANILCQYIFWERWERRMNYKIFCKQNPEDSRCTNNNG